MRCPFCEAEAPELVSLFGSQLLLSQYRCTACGTYFEGVRDSDPRLAANAASTESPPPAEGSRR